MATHLIGYDIHPSKGETYDDLFSGMLIRFGHTALDVVVMPRPSFHRIRGPDRASLDRTLRCSGPVASRRDIPTVRRRKIRSGRHPGCGFSNRRMSSQNPREPRDDRLGFLSVKNRGARAARCKADGRCHVVRALKRGRPSNDGVSIVVHEAFGIAGRADFVSLAAIPDVCVRLSARMRHDLRLIGEISGSIFEVREAARPTILRQIAFLAVKRRADQFAASGTPKTVLVLNPRGIHGAHRIEWLKESAPHFEQVELQPCA